jgi:hypothetical protein
VVKLLIEQDADVNAIHLFALSLFFSTHIYPFRHAVMARLNILT